MCKAISAILAMTAVVAFAGQEDIAKWDPRMAADKAVVDTNGVKWIDGRYLPIEGRWNLGDTKHYYMRLPDSLTTNVNGGVRGMRDNTSGMIFRFRTDSNFLVLRHTPLHGWHAMPHMTEVGTSGWDVYRLDKESGKWRFVASNHGARNDTAHPGARLKRISWTPGDECIINLPLYNGVKEFELGIAAGSKVEAPSPWASGVTKPVVFYGTSITHGGCCSRPGLGFVNLVGRHLDVPVVGLGFSGSGVMEYEMSEHLARIDASCYVLDCLWNMGSKAGSSRPGRNVEDNYEPFIRNLRAKRPGVPIIMAEHCNVYGSAKNEKDDYIRKLYEKLKAEDPSWFERLFCGAEATWDNLFYLPNDEMYTGDYEGTVDGCHPNDLGMMSMSEAFGKAVKEALHLR